MSKHATALSLFSGIGGLDIGARVAGAEPLLSTEHDREALDLLRRGTGAATVPGPIETVRELLSSLWPSAQPPSLVVGGPPCTAFSHAGFWLQQKRDGQDPAADLLKSYVSVVEDVQPLGFVLENVPGLAFKTHRRFLSDLIASAERAGYSVGHAILNAADFGVPQARRRLFLVGVRGRRRHVELQTWPHMPSRSAGWALSGLGPQDQEPNEVPTGQWGHLLPRVPPGQNYLVFTDRYGFNPPLFRNRGRYWSFLLKLDPTRPSHTLPAQRVTFNGPFHWENRHLRVREMARLQGFPDGYPLSVDLANARRHIGNAVPPLLAAAVVWRVLAAIDLADATRLPPALEVAREPTSTAAQVSEALLDGINLGNTGAGRGRCGGGPSAA